MVERGLVVPDDIMETIRDEIHDGTNILYPYEIPLTIPILECILKRNELTMYKDSITKNDLILNSTPENRL